MASSKSFKKQLIGVVMAVGVIAGLFGLWTFYNTHETGQAKPMRLESGYMLPNPKSIQPFELTDQHQRAFKLGDLKGYWSFVFFGFTNCQNICPASLGQLNKMYQQLQKADANPMPQVIFVSIDPERDTPSVLNRYIKSFNSHFVGLTGGKQNVAQFSQQFNVLYTKVKQDNGQYTVDHSGTLMLVDPQGRLVAMFTQPLDPKNLSQDYMKIAQHYTTHVYKHSIVRG